MQPAISIGLYLLEDGGTKLFLTCFTYGTHLEDDAVICKPFLLLYHSCVLIPHQTATYCLSSVYCREVSIVPNYS